MRTIQCCSGGPKVLGIVIISAILTIIILGCKVTDLKLQVRESSVLEGVIPTAITNSGMVLPLP